MKKLAVSAIASSLLLMSVSSSISYAASPNEVSYQQNETTKKEDNTFNQHNEIKNLSVNQQDMIKSVQKYVNVNDGKIEFIKDIPQNDYEKYNLKELQKHFDFLNSQVTQNKISINQDLSISNKSISTLAVYGEWTYHWWGYDRKFNNKQAKAYVNELNDLVAYGNLAGAAAAALMPIVGGAVVVTAQYYNLLANRVTANNEGNGVYVGMTWAIVFTVDAL